MVKELDIYGKLMERHPPYSREEQTRAFEKLASLPKDSEEYLELRDEISLHNVGLVLMILGRVGVKFKDSYIHDYFQVGFMGLLRAMETYDVTRGNAFGTYAVYWIRQAVQRVMPEVISTVRVPAHAFVQGVRTHIVSFDEYDYLRDDILVDHTPVVHNLERLRDVLKRVLTKREYFVIAGRYGLDQKPMTLQQIGNKLRYTRERIRQIEVKALNKLQIPEHLALLGDIWNSANYNTTYDYRQAPVGGNGIPTPRSLEDTDSGHYNYRHRNQLDNIVRLWEDTRYERPWGWG